MVVFVGWDNSWLAQQAELMIVFLFLQGGTITEDQDLAAIGITDEDHRTAIVSAAHQLPPIEPIGENTFCFTLVVSSLHFFSSFFLGGRGEEIDK